MRIGFDATALPEQLFGAGNYIVQLIQALLRLDADNEYVIFSKSLHARFFDSTRARIVCPTLPSRLVRIAWEQTVLPFLVRQHDLDLLHSPHYTMPLAKPCRSVVTFHDMTFFLYPELHLVYKSLFFRAIMPLAARRADMLVAASENTRADIHRLLRVPLEKIRAIYYGVNARFPLVAVSAARAIARDKYRLPNEFILYVGNLEPRKNLLALVGAYRRLVGRGIEHALVIVGKQGWQYQEIFSATNTQDLKDHVLFLGYVPQHDLPGLYLSAGVFVYPSLYEGFGLPVLEAMACGTPVITSNVSSLPEIVGDAGILVSPHDEQALADAIQSVITDRSLSRKLADAGRARAAIFSWERAARETLSVYEHIFKVNDPASVHLYCHP